MNPWIARKSFSSVLATAGLVALGVLAPMSHASDRSLGVVSFANSGSPAAQAEREHRARAQRKILLRECALRAVGEIGVRHPRDFLATAQKVRDRARVGDVLRHAQRERFEFPKVFFTVCSMARTAGSSLTSQRTSSRLAPSFSACAPVSRAAASLEL